MKVVFTEKFVVLNAYYKIKNFSNVFSLPSQCQNYLNKPETEGQIQPKANIRWEIIRIKAKINEIENFDINNRIIFIRFIEINVIDNFL